MDEHSSAPHGVEVATAYGKRRTCSQCGLKWTIINGDREWVEETYSSMAENVREVGYNDAQEA